MCAGREGRLRQVAEGGGRVMPSEALRMAPGAGNARCAHGDRRRVRSAAACQASERPRAVSDADRGGPPENSLGAAASQGPRQFQMEDRGWDSDGLRVSGPCGLGQMGQRKPSARGVPGRRVEVGKAEIIP